MPELAARAGPDTLAAMNGFIKRIMGTDDAAELAASSNTSSSSELARLLYWLMVVGYSLRAIEVRFDMERSLGRAGGGDEYLGRMELPPPGGL